MALCFTETPLPLAAGAVIAFGLVAEPAVSAPATTQVVAVSGQAVPDGNGTFDTFFNFFVPGTTILNDAGHAAFVAQLTGTSNGNDDNMAIFRGDGAAPLVQVARAGDPSPDGNGTFSAFPEISLNDAGLMAFGARLVGTANPGDPLTNDR